MGVGDIKLLSRSGHSLGGTLAVERFEGGSFVEVEQLLGRRQDDSKWVQPAGVPHCCWQAGTMLFRCLLIVEQFLSHRGVFGRSICHGCSGWWHHCC